MSTTWSRRRRNEPCPSLQAHLSVAAQFKHVGRIQLSHVFGASERAFSRKRDGLAFPVILFHVIARQCALLFHVVQSGGYSKLEISRGCWKTGFEGALQASEAGINRVAGRWFLSPDVF